jgi:PIN domain nuclease of toxin-antitoxin system
MPFLIDTHAFIWFFEGNPRLSADARSVMKDRSTELRFSVACLWELAILVSIGKVTLNQRFDVVVSQTLDRNDIVVLDVSLPHATRYVDLPLHHRDPFDRLIVAQALTEQLTIISNDAQLDMYEVSRRW